MINAIGDQHLASRAGMIDAFLNALEGSRSRTVTSQRGIIVYVYDSRWCERKFVRLGCDRAADLGSPIHNGQS